MAECLLLGPDDFLDGLGAPRASLDGGVVRHHADRSPADRGHAGHDAVRAEALLLPVREQGLLGEGAGVDEPVHALADGQLALLGGLLAVALGAARACALERFLQIRHARDDNRALALGGAC